MSVPVIKDFYADWCGPCKMQTPILEALKKKHGDKVEVEKIDVDAHGALATEYAIRVVPTLVIEKDGKIIKRIEGVADLATLESYLKSFL
ncbi:MAG: thiol reductase thioredoxin [Methanomicrobiales archaeon]|jgi:thioredoxin 1|nr:thiol reductase thioredoxin [Methanomicrobiales archaeon]